MVKNLLTISRRGQALNATSHRIAERTQASAPNEPDARQHARPARLSHERTRARGLDYRSSPAGRAHAHPARARRSVNAERTRGPAARRIAAALHLAPNEPDPDPIRAADRGKTKPPARSARRAADSQRRMDPL
jgi:hypothetical protein